MDGLCIELGTDGMTHGKRVVIYKTDDNPLTKRLELSLDEAIFVAKTIIDLTQSESHT